MSKITIKDLYLIFGNDKQHALRMLKEEKSKSEILKATGCTVAVKDANLSIREGEIFVIMGLSGSGKSTLLNDIICKSLAHDLNRAKTIPGKHQEIKGIENLDKIIE